MTEYLLFRPQTCSARLSLCCVLACVLSFVATNAQTAPILLTEGTGATTRAVAFESVSRRSEPFAVTSPIAWSTDARTRVMLFAMNVQLLPSESLDATKALTAEAEDASGKIYPLKVEYVGKPPYSIFMSDAIGKGFRDVPQGWLFAIVVRLHDQMTENMGDVVVRINLHGVRSNPVRIAIGQIGGGPPDAQVGAVPNPAPASTPAPAPDLVPNPFTGPAASADAIRFLEQASWGPTNAEVSRVQQIGFKSWLDEQFNMPTTSPASYTLMHFDSEQGCPTGSPTTCFRDNYTLHPIQQKFFTNALYGQDQLRQRTAWALHQIFVVSGLEIQQPSWMGYYIQTIDKNAFGNYRTLLKDITLNVGMGEYLNMRGNTRTNPNENYAREILQLFSVGVDELNLDGTPKLDANGRRIPVYDQEDITNFARVFTGWNWNQTGMPQGVLNYRDPMIVTNANNHDIGQKTLLNGFVIQPFAGGTNQQRIDYANQSLDLALDNIFNHPNVGPFVGKQLIQHLVTSNPSPAYVERVARVFNNDCDALYTDGCSNQRGNLKAVVRAVLLDPEARGDLKNDVAYGKLREPVQLINNTLRAFNATGFNGTGQSDGVIGENSSSNFPRNLGQRVYMPDTVFSYYSPLYEVPGTGLFGPAFEILSTSTALQRANTVNTFVYSGINTNSNRPTGTALSFTSLEQQASNPSQLADTLNALLLHSTMSPGMKAQIVNALNAVPTSDAQFARKRAQAAAYLVLTSPQFQVQR